MNEWDMHLTLTTSSCDIETHRDVRQKLGTIYRKLTYCLIKQKLVASLNCCVAYLCICLEMFCQESLRENEACMNARIRDYHNFGKMYS